MSQNIRFKTLFRAIFLVPLFNAPVAVALMGEVIFYESGGPINGYLKLLGIGAIPWRSSPVIAPWTVVITDVWMWTPFCFLIILAGIEAIPRAYIEAAMVDGASGFKIFRHITLPMITTPIITVLMFRIVDCLKIFEIPFVMIGGGGPGIATETLTVYIYKIAFRDFNLGYASAQTVIYLIVISIIAMIFLRWARRFYA